jgi:antitoxin VapB
MLTRRQLARNFGGLAIAGRLASERAFAQLRLTRSLNRAQTWNKSYLLTKRLDFGQLLAYAWHMLKKGSGSERHVRVFRNGRNQAVRIPREFELPVEDAIMRKEGHRLIIEPAPAKSLRAVLAGLKPLREKFPRISDRAADPVDL